MTDNWKQSQKTKAQNAEFSHAYSFQIKHQESATAEVSDEFYGISFDEICDDLLKVIFLMENERTPATMRSIKTILKKIPATYSQFIPTWADKSDMDLFHHAIINNCPEIVECVLADCNWFPATYIPDVNPYAHLAAIFGHTECLRLILNYRPSHYFSATNHILKLPSNVRKKVKYNDNINKGVKRQINKLLGKIQSSENMVEMPSLQDPMELGNLNEVSNTLADEFKALESSKKELGHGMRKIQNTPFSNKTTTAAKSRKHEKVSFANIPSTNGNKRTPSRESIDSIKFHVTRNGKQAKHHRLPIGEAGKKHIISVYCDEFSEAPQGVVNGAGQRVIVKYCEGTMKLKEESADTFYSSVLGRHTSLMPSISARRKSSRLASERRKSTLSPHYSRNDSNPMLPKVVEAGVRGRGKYKEFQLKIESRKIIAKDSTKSLRNKTPLSLAAEYGHLDCVNMILETYVLKNHPTTAVKEPLTLATKAKSPDTILFLMNQRITIPDYQSAVLTAIRDMYPDCLTALLAQRTKERHSLFDGVNLYHILYTQSLMSDYRFEMLPIMTNVLISSNEDVNAHNVYCTFPIYTLINCAFHISIGRKIFYYINCLKMLLESKANPHYDELRDQKLPCIGQSFSRSAYSSAIDCILDNAVISTNFFENTRSSKLFMKKLISTVTMCDRTNRRILNDVLFNYMNTICSLGIDHYIVRCLLRYGANPDFCIGKKYAINTYFDNILPYLTKFEVANSYNVQEQEINALLTLCRGMSYKCLKEAELIFLNENLMQCPIQALPLLRYFAFGLDQMLKSPRSLMEIVGQFIWHRFRRNEKKVKALPLPDEIIAFILP